MLWGILLAVHLIGLVGYSLLLRRVAVAGKLHPWVLATLLQTGIMLPMLAAVPFLPIELGRIDSSSAVAMGGIVVLGVFLLFGITKTLEYLQAGTFSIVYSMRAVIVTLLAAVLLSELPSLAQILGGLLIVAATLIVRQKEGKQLARRGMMWAIAMAVTVSLLGVVEKHVINEVGVFTAAPIITLLVGVIMWTVLLVKRYPLPKKDIVTRPILLLMLLRSLSNWGFVFALAVGALVSVATFVSSLSVVAIVALGALLLGEQEHLKRNAVAVVIAVAGLTAVLLGGHLWPLTLSQQPGREAVVVTHSTEQPSEERPSDTYDWRGSAHDPKKIIISIIGVDAYIQNVGVDQNQEVAVPNNIHMGGWFVDSVRPGEKGLSIIDGHLNGNSRDGIFIDLEKVTTGDTYVIEFGDGSKRDFRVKDVKIVDLEDAAGVLFSQDPSIASQLTLITCGGTYDKQARLYDKRVIVTSELL